MTTGFKSVLKTSIPIVVDLASQIVMWAIEINLVGHISDASMARFFPGSGARGVDAITAVGNVVQIIILTCTILLIFIFGASMIISRLLGEGRKEEANHFLGQSLFTNLFAVALISIAWYSFAPFIFRTILGTPDAVTVVGVEYFRILSFFAPFILMNFVAIGIVRGAGDTHLSMVTALLINSIHLLLAIFLIFGVSFFPELGVKGAALAAGIAHTIGCCFTFSVILKGRSVLTFSFKDMLDINYSSIVRVIKTGTPITLEQVAWMVGVTVVIGFTNRLGPVVAAAHIIVLTFQRLFSMLYQAFGIGTLTLVSKRYGANEHEHAGITVKYFILLVGLVVLFIAILVFARARYFALLFTSDPKVVALCETVLRLVAVIQIPKALTFILSYSLRGIGENKYPMFLTIVGVIVFEIAVGFNLAFTLGLSLVGIWLAQGMDESFKLVMIFKKFRSRLRELVLAG